MTNLRQLIPSQTDTCSLSCSDTNTSHLDVLHCIAKLILTYVSLPRLHLTTGVLLMKPWIRKTAPVSPQLFVHIRQPKYRKTEQSYFPGGKGGRRSTQIRSVSFFNISCKNKTTARKRFFFPFSEEKHRADSCKLILVTKRTVRVVTWFSLLLTTKVFVCLL